MENQQNQDSNQPLYHQLDNFKPDTGILGPNNPPWNSPVAFLMWMASIALIILIPTIGIAIYLLTKEVKLNDAQKLTDLINSDSNAVLVNIICVIPAHILTILLAWLVVTNNRKQSFTEMLGWKLGGFNFFYLVAIVVGFFVVAGVVGYFIPEKENDLIKILRSSRTAVLAVAFMATFTAPLVEEVVYRGIMYSAFQRTFGVATAVGLVTFLFALVHVPQYYPSYSTIFLICLLSLVLTLVRVKSENLLPCVILHTIFNGLQSSLLIAEPYLQNLSTESPQPALFYLLN